MIAQQQFLFRETCQTKDISCHIFKEQEIKADELLAESRFADIVTINGNPDKELFSFLLKKKKTLVVILQHN